MGIFDRLGNFAKRFFEGKPEETNEIGEDDFAGELKEDDEEVDIIDEQYIINSMKNKDEELVEDLDEIMFNSSSKSAGELSGRIYKREMNFQDLESNLNYKVYSQTHFRQPKAMPGSASKMLPMNDSKSYIQVSMGDDVYFTGGIDWDVTNHPSGTTFIGSPKYEVSGHQGTKVFGNNGDETNKPEDFEKYITENAMSLVKHFRKKVDKLDDFREELKAHKISQEGILKDITQGGKLLVGGKDHAFTFVTMKGQTCYGIVESERGEKRVFVMESKDFKEDNESFYINSPILGRLGTRDGKDKIIVDKRVNTISGALDTLYNETRNTKPEFKIQNYKPNSDNRDNERMARLSQLLQGKIEFKGVKNKVNYMVINLKGDTLYATPNVVIGRNGKVYHDIEDIEYRKLKGNLSKVVRENNNKEQVMYFINSFDTANDLRKTIK